MKNQNLKRNIYKNVKNNKIHINPTKCIGSLCEDYKTLIREIKMI